MATKIKYWRMGVQYTNSRNVQWGSKRFSSAGEVMRACAEWASKNENVLAHILIRSDYEYRAEESNPAR